MLSSGMCFSFPDVSDKLVLNIKYCVSQSDIPSFRSLLVVEERMRSSGCLSTSWQQEGTSGHVFVCISYPSWNVLSLHSSSFTTIPSPV